MCVGMAVSMKHCSKGMEHCSKGMEHCSRSMEHYSRNMEHCSKGMEHCRRSMEQCTKREGILQGHEDRSPVRGLSLSDAAVDGGQQTGTEVWNLRAGLCASGIFPGRVCPFFFS
jgi:hypothetical protein